jgi:type IV pilus biogenesis protein CpaD/CtpE
MKKFILIFCATIALTACVAKPEPKVNVLTDVNREIVVQSPKCPDWTGGLDHDGSANLRNFETQNSYSNYGCATVNNFGKMIDDPMDMISGKSTDFYDGQTTSNAVRTNRTAQTSN